MKFGTFQHAQQSIININHRLTVEEQQLRQQLIHHFIQTSPQHLNYDVQYQALLNKHILALDQHQHIIHLYPFSMLPTNKTIYLPEAQSSLFAMCAIDAMGIHFTLHQDLTIHAQCELTQTPITLTLSQGQITSPDNSSTIRVLHTDLSDISDWANTCCNQMHFFIDEHALTKWVRTHGCQEKTYYSLSLEEALIIANKLFYTTYSL